MLFHTHCISPLLLLFIFKLSLWFVSSIYFQLASSPCTLPLYLLSISPIPQRSLASLIINYSVLNVLYLNLILLVLL